VTLFALLIQFAVSFGHVHADHGRMNVPSASTLAADDNQPDSDHADAVCAICILHQMLGTAHTAAPPAVPLVFVSHTAARTFATERIAPEPPPSAFRSRAPPLA
jgi:hypothetical protein